MKLTFRYIDLISRSQPWQLVEPTINLLLDLILILCTLLPCSLLLKILPLILDLLGAPVPVLDFSVVVEVALEFIPSYELLMVDRIHRLSLVHHFVHLVLFNLDQHLVESKH